MAQLPVFERKNHNYGSLQGSKHVTASDEWYTSLQDGFDYGQNRRDQAG
jgi:hypothetical protein